MATSRILVVEDTPSLSTIYCALLRKAGYEVDLVETLKDAIQQLETRAHHVVIVDLMLPDGDGEDLLRHAVQICAPATLIVATADGSIKRAVAAMREGAYDFLVKPFSEERLLTIVKNAVERASLQKQVAAARENVDLEQFHGFIGASLAMQAVYRAVRNVAGSTATVFITGESGTGKEVCAEALHQESKRSGGPFIALNCGAIPKDLLESEVFGHLKGSFTGAIADRKGAAELAHGGTLFLDEICEMDTALQTKLLRFLQTSTIQPVGAGVTKKVDARIICATNRDPMAEVAAGRFREDLFYRLHVIPIHLPPLREREQDAVAIAEVLLNRFGQEEGKDFEGFSDAAEAALLAHPWPGNVRELQNVVRQIAVMQSGGKVDLDGLPALAGPMGRAPGAEAPAGAVRTVFPTRLSAPTFLGKSLDVIEREVIEATISHFAGSIPKAAKALDVSPSTIYRKREAWQAAEGSAEPSDGEDHQPTPS